MAVQSKFPFLKLPILVVDMVLSEFNLAEIIQLSLLSKRCLYFLRLSRIPKVLLNISLHNECVKINFSLRNGIALNDSWLFYCERQRLDSDPHSIGGFKMSTGLRNDTLVSSTYYDTPNCVRAAILHLKELFKCSVNKFTIGADGILRRTLTKVFNECEHLEVNGKFSILGGELSEIIENWNPAKKITLNVLVQGEVVLREWETPRSIIILRDPHWISMDRLLDFELVDVSIFNCNYTREDCQWFIDNWFSFDDTNFRQMEFYWRHGQNPIEDRWSDNPYRNLNLEMPMRVYDPNLRGPNYLCRDGHALNCTDGRDILRSDGLLATIKISPVMIFFGVWHNRFPDMTGVEVHQLPTIGISPGGN